MSTQLTFHPIEIQPEGLSFFDSFNNLLVHSLQCVDVTLHIICCVIVSQNPCSPFGTHLPVKSSTLHWLNCCRFYPLECVHFHWERKQLISKKELHKFSCWRKDRHTSCAVVIMVVVDQDNIWFTVMVERNRLQMWSDECEFDIPHLADHMNDMGTTPELAISELSSPWDARVKAKSCCLPILDKPMRVCQEKYCNLAPKLSHRKTYWFLQMMCHRSHQTFTINCHLKQMIVFVLRWHPHIISSLEIIFVEKHTGTAFSFLSFSCSSMSASSSSLSK